MEAARLRDRSLISESYEIRRLMPEVTLRIAIIMQGLGAWEAGKSHRRIKLLSDPDDKRQWVRISNEKTHNGHWSKKKRCEVAFENFRYSPDSKMVWGEESVSEERNVEVDGFREVIRNNSENTVLERDIERSIELEDSTSRSYSREISTEVTSTTSASGSYMGVEVSQEISIKVGATFSSNEATESRNTRNETRAVHLSLDPGESVVVTLEKDKAITVTPYHIDGVLDFDLLLNFPDWTHSEYMDWTHEGSKKVEFDSFRSFMQFLEGYDTRYPHMRDFIDKCPPWVYKAVDWLRDPTNRTIKAIGELRREFDNNARLELEDE